MSNFEILVRAVIGIILFASWMLLTYFPAPNATALLAFIPMAIGALAGHSLKSGTTSGS